MIPEIVFKMSPCPGRLHSRGNKTNPDHLPEEWVDIHDRVLSDERETAGTLGRSEFLLLLLLQDRTFFKHARVLIFNGSIHTHRKTLKEHEHS